jgi:hypothetical protein
MLNYGWRVVKEAGKLVWLALVNYPVPAALGVVVYYPTVYYITWRSSFSAHDQSHWTEAMWDFHVAAQAFLWSVVIVFLISVLFLAPYQLWKEEKGRADRNEAGLLAIGEERPLLLTGMSFGWDWIETEDDEGPALTSITLKHDNRGARHLRYSIENAWIEVLGRRIDLPTVQRGVIVAPYIGGIFQFQLPEAVRIDEFPADHQGEC